MNLARLTVAASMGLCALNAAAVDVSGTTSGTWVNPVPAVGITSTGLGTANVTFGSPADEVGPNAFAFSGTAFSSPTEVAFKVGSMRYYNGTTAAGSNPGTFDLALTLSFADAAIGNVASNFTFQLESTTNGGEDPDADADFVTLPSPFSATTFTIGSTSYTVKFTGFQNVMGDGFLTSDASVLHVREGSFATADLFASVTTKVAAIPEPQTYALMGMGLAAMAWVARRRKHAAH